MMQYKGYVGNVEFDDEANIFHGDVINLRDVITFQGKTVDELRHAFQESIDDYQSFVQNVVILQRNRTQESSWFALNLNCIRQ